MRQCGKGRPCIAWAAGHPGGAGWAAASGLRGGVGTGAQYVRGSAPGLLRSCARGDAQTGRDGNYMGGRNHCNGGDLRGRAGSEGVAGERR